MARADGVLTINAGSSSIRFALYPAGGGLRVALHGLVERIGLLGATLSVFDADGVLRERRALDAADYRGVVQSFLDWLEQQAILTAVRAVGHRFVHGMAHRQPEPIDAALVEELRRIVPLDPEHLPREIELVEAIQQRYPGLLQVACFDTAFHRDMPRLAKLLPIPRRFQGQGVERYGFHGLSYTFLMEELRRLADPAATKGRVILAHLGSGASLAAVRDGCSVDTTMGFTPASGLMMGTRSGDLDPGLGYYFAQAEGLSAEQFQSMVNQESGLLGVSETSPDVRDLLAREATDTRAAEAIALFCYQAKKGIGAFAAALGGVDTLVFSGGIGEHAPRIRERICSGLDFLGIRVDPALNDANAPVISPASAAVSVRVIHTDEEQMIARQVGALLARLPDADAASPS